MAAPQPAEKETYNRSGQVFYDRPGANDPHFAQSPKLRVVSSNASVKKEDPSTNNTAVRRTTADRSDLKGPTVIYNVRTSSMPGAPKNTKDSSHQTIDEQFQGSYAKQGLQPYSLDDAPDQRPYEPIPQVTRRTEVEYEDQTLPQEPEEQEYVESTNTGSVPIKTNKDDGADLSTRVRARTVTAFISSWAWFLYFFFQLPFVILLTVTMALAGALAALAGAFEAKPGDNWFDAIWKGIGSAVGTVASVAAENLLRLFGAELEALNPMAWFAGLYNIMIAYAIIVLMTIYLQYKLAGLDPLSGRSAGLKVGALLLAFIGYCIPLLNFFPWFVVWTTVVVLRPK